MDRRTKQKVITKKHLARIERERIQRRWIIIASVAVLVLVVGLIGFGILEQKVLVPRQAVAIVGPDRISMREFQDRVRYQRYQLVQQYVNTYQTMQLFGSDANTQAFFTQNLKQIQLQLDPTTMGDDVLSLMIQDKLIRQEAARRGITVSKDEVDKAIQEAFGFYAGGAPPTSTPQPTTAPTSTLSPLQMTLVPPTATPTVTPTPTATLTVTQTATPTPGITATPVITSTQGVTSTSQGTSTPEVTPTASPTPTPYTTQAFGTDYQTFLSTIKKQINVSETELRSIFEGQLYRQKVMDAITADLPHTQEQVWARHILVSSEDVAKQIYEKLQSGGDFVALAAQYSTDQSNAKTGGDLGWFPTGKMDPDFEKVAFALSIGEISQPVKTQFGWHIIQVLGHENRPLSASDYDQLRQTTFSDWLSKQRLDPSVKTFDNWQALVPTEPAIPTQMLQP